MWTKGFYKTAYSPTVPTHAQGNLGGFTPQTYEIHLALQDTYFKVKQMAVGSPPLPPPFFSLTVPTHAQGNLGGFTPQTYEIHLALQDTYFKVKQMAVGSPPLPPPLFFPY